MKSDRASFKPRVPKRLRTHFEPVIGPESELRQVGLRNLKLLKILFSEPD